MDATIICTHSFGTKPEYVTDVDCPGVNDDVDVNGVVGFGRAVTADSDGTLCGAPAGSVVDVVVEVDVVVVSTEVVEVAAAAFRAAASAANCDT